MADSAVRFLLLSTTVWTLLQTPEIQAQNSSISANSASPFSVSPLSSLATQRISATFSSNSTTGFVSSMSGRSSSFLTNVSSTQFVSSDTITSQAIAAGTIAPTTTSQPLISSTPAPPSQSVTSSPTTKEDLKSDEDDKESFTTTEYILIACLGALVFVLIAIIVLVLQIIRLNKSVLKLKATSHH